MPNLSQWFTVLGAAGRLECSTKTVQRLASRGKIKTQLWNRPAGASIMMYRPADVERLRPERLDAVKIMPAPSSPELKIKSKTRPVPVSVPVYRKIFLSRHEAAAISGLPLTWIDLAIKTKRLPAILSGSGWRILNPDVVLFCEEIGDWKSRPTIAPRRRLLATGGGLRRPELPATVEPSKQDL